MKNTFGKDYYRATGRNWKWYKVLRLHKHIGIQYLYLLRKETTTKGVVAMVYKKLREHKRRKYALYVNTHTIGGGLVIGHPHNIVINSKVIIGCNVTVQNGVTIGKDFRGKRCGAPVIGNNVYIGANATIVGNVIVGDDVVIAPNTFVNFDVPKHSIVIGVPGEIKCRENATEGFLFNLEENSETEA